MDVDRKSSLAIFRAIACGAVCVPLATTALAGGRPDNEQRSWFPEFSAGWAFPQSDTENILDDDWTLSGGALYWPADWAAGVEFSLGYSNLDLSGAAIDAINDRIAVDPSNSGRIDDGDVTTWALTINGIWGPGRRSNGLYLTAGVGAYYMDAELTNTGLAYYPPFCDPWYWWWCVPGGVGPASIVQASDSTTEFGWNAGLGYSIGAGDGQIFLEARYFSIDTPSEELTFVPFTVGYRW